MSLLILTIRNESNENLIEQKVRSVNHALEILKRLEQPLFQKFGATLGAGIDDCDEDNGSYYALEANGWVVSDFNGNEGDDACAEAANDIQIKLAA